MRKTGVEGRVERKRTWGTGRRTCVTRNGEYTEAAVVRFK